MSDHGEMAYEIMHDAQADLDKELADMTIDQMLAKAQIYATLAVAHELERMNGGLTVRTEAPVSS